MAGSDEERGSSRRRGDGVGGPARSSKKGSAGARNGKPRNLAGKVGSSPRAAAGKAIGVSRTVAGKATAAPQDVAGDLYELLANALPRSEPDELAQDALDHAGGAGEPGPSPFVGFGMRDLIGGLRLAGTQAVRQPGPLVRSLPSTTLELLRIGLGRSQVGPDRGDKRFRDPAWDNFISRRVVQTYLELGFSVEGFVDHSRLEDDGADRARFALNLVRDALSPANALLTNPQALKRALNTKGGSLVHGLRNWGDDVLHNGGMPNQVDRRPFAVGKNLAITPGAVVHRTPVFELLHYAPQTDQVYERPLMIIPPQVNKYYALDLRPGRSMYEYLVQHGVQLFGVSWRNPTAAERDWGFETYIEALVEATDVVREISGMDDLNALGGCAGGIMLTLLTSYLTGKGDPRINAATTLVTLLDSHTHSDVLLFATPKTIAAAKALSARRGVLEGRQMAQVFAWLRPNDLVWNYWVNNYLLGQDPPSFDILAWNADTTRLPARFHGQLLDLVSRNQLLEAGELEILGVPIDVSQISCDTYIVGGITDHITPWQGCYRTAHLLGGSSQFVLVSSGHIQTLIASLDNPKLSYYVNSELPGDPQAWLAGATQHQGSWWPHWTAWLHEHGGELRDAPSELGSDRHPVREPAPGRYVLG